MARPSTPRLALISSLCGFALLLAVNQAVWAQAQAPAPAPALTLALAVPATTSRVPQPVIESARAGQCVGAPAFMRRQHMELLKHQRDDTVRAGNRSGKYSLNACIACHASQTSQSVTAEAGNFCQSCHNYAAVKIDCFECHANKLAGSAAAQQAAP